MLRQHAVYNRLRLHRVKILSLWKTECLMEKEALLAWGDLSSSAAVPARINFDLRASTASLQKYVYSHAPCRLINSYQTWVYTDWISDYWTTTESVFTWRTEHKSEYANLIAYRSAETSLLWEPLLHCATKPPHWNSSHEQHLHIFLVISGLKLFNSSSTSLQNSPELQWFGLS